MRRFKFKPLYMILDAISNLVFPALCLHCKDELAPKGKKLLCSSCLELLKLIELTFRCRKCFGSFEEASCRCSPKGSAPLEAMAAACEYIGPAASLVKMYKYRKTLALAKDLSALMVLQLTRLNWPMPDLIVPVPQSFSHFLLRGFNQTDLLAREVGQLLGCPTLNILKRKSGDFSQAHLKKEQREKLSSASFFLKRNVLLEGKRILLVDDVLTTGATLKASAERLKETFPQSIHALTFCLS